MEDINNAVENIRDKHGKGSIMQMDGGKLSSIETISTGSLTLDKALGGGIPRGRVSETYGSPGVGKSSLALSLTAQVQKKGLNAAFIDVENALNVEYAKNLGVSVNDLWISQPNSGEAALDIAEQLIKSGEIGIVVVDSVAALVPKAELEGEMGDSQVGLRARLMSQALRKMTGAISKTKAILFFTNQIRAKISGGPWGPSTQTSGGKALRFHTTVRMKMWRSKQLKKQNEHVGNRVTVEVTKNKIYPPHKKAEFSIIFGEGISHVRELVTLGAELDIIDKKTSWYSYEDERLGQGVKNSAEFLEEHEEIAEEIRDKIEKKIE